VWQIFFDREVEKWLIAEYTKSVLNDNLSFYFRIDAEHSCARRNGLYGKRRGIPFWSMEEGDDYE